MRLRPGRLCGSGILVVALVVLQVAQYAPPARAATSTPDPEPLSVAPLPPQAPAAANRTAPGAAAPAGLLVVPDPAAAVSTIPAVTSATCLNLREIQVAYNQAMSTSGTTSVEDINHYALTGSGLFLIGGRASADRTSVTLTVGRSTGLEANDGATTSRDPATYLANGVPYTLSITNVGSATFQLLGSASGTFTCADTTPPTIAAPEQTGSATIVLTFSKPMNPNTVEAGLRWDGTALLGSPTAKLTWQELTDNNCATRPGPAEILPTAAFGCFVNLRIDFQAGSLPAAGAHTLQLSGATDAAGNHLGPDPTPFNVTIAADTTAPSVPGVSVSNIGNFFRLRVNYSESMAFSFNGFAASDSADTAANYILRNPDGSLATTGSAAGAGVPITISRVQPPNQNGSRVVSSTRFRLKQVRLILSTATGFVPTLRPNTPYTVEIQNVRDEAGNFIAPGTVRTFSWPGDSTPPQALRAFLSGNKLLVDYSEDMTSFVLNGTPPGPNCLDPGGATAAIDFTTNAVTPANYSSPNATLQAALATMTCSVVSGDDTGITFTLGSTPPTATYELDIASVRDPFGNLLSPNPTVITLNPAGTAPTIALSPATLPAGTVGVPYSQTITASGGTAPYTLAVTSGALPAGLTLSSGGLLSGTPTATGTFTFSVIATDNVGFTGSQSYTIIITSPPEHLDASASPATLTADGVSTTTLTVCLRDAANAPITGRTDTINIVRDGTATTPSSTTGNLSATTGCIAFAVTATNAAGTDAYSANDASATVASAIAQVTTVSPPSVLDQQQLSHARTGESLLIGFTSQQKLAQTVTAGFAGELSEVRMPIACTTNADLTLTIQGVSAGKPDGVIRSTRTFPGSSLPQFNVAPVVFRRFVLTTPVSLANGEKFAIVLASTGISESQFCQIAQGPSLLPPNDAYPPGAAFFENATTQPDWGQLGLDNPFQTFMTPPNTPTGANVAVTPVDTTTGTTPVSLKFATVTQAGTTSLTTSATGPTPPANFAVLGTYYNLKTTALFVPPATVCITYTGSVAPRLEHFENGVWVDRTTTVDTVTKVVCGDVTSLSPFALLVRTAPPTLDQQETQIDLGTGGLNIGGGSQQQLAQVVTAGFTGNLTEIRMPVSCTTNADLIVTIQGVTGGKPNGSVGSTQTYPAATLPIATIPLVAFRSLPLSTPVSLSGGEQFAIVLSSTGASATQNCLISQGPSNPPPFDAYPGGAAFAMQGSTAWGQLGLDLPFQTFMAPVIAGLFAFASPGMVPANGTATSTISVCGVSGVNFGVAVIPTFTDQIALTAVSATATTLLTTSPQTANGCANFTVRSTGAAGTDTYSATDATDSSIPGTTAQVGTKPSLSGTGTATIDGVLTPGEWDKAGHVDFAVNLGGGATTPARLLVMNDATNLYIALRVQIPATTPTSFRNVVMEFDNAHDGVIGEGDDVFVLDPPNNFFDEYRTFLPPCPPGVGLCGLLDTQGGGTNDGKGVFAVSGGFAVYEVSKPLNSGDTRHDFSLKAGDTAGWTMVLLVCVGPPGANACAQTNLPAGGLGDITIASTADVAITKTGLASVVVGTPITYTLTVTTSGNATNVTVNDPLQPSFTFGSATASQDAATAVSTDVPKAIPDPGQVTSILGFPTAGTILDMTLFFRFTHACERDLRMVLRHPDGTSVVVMDRGNQTCTGVPTTFGSNNPNLGPFFANKQAAVAWSLDVTDDSPGFAGTLDFWSLTIRLRQSCSFANGAVSCNLGNLASGATATVTITAIPTQVAAQVNAATVTANEPDPNTSNNSSSMATTVTQATPSIATAPSTPAALAGTAISDTANVTGGFSPTGTVTFKLYRPSDPTCSGTPVYVTQNVALVNGTASSGSFTPAEGGTYRWVATYNGDANNIQVTSGCASEPVTITPQADLAITKSASPDPAFVGGQVAFTLIVSNAGPSTAQAVTVVDTLPPGTTFSSASPGCTLSAGAVSCNLGDIAPKASASATITVMVNAAGTVANTATVSSSTGDPSTANNSATATFKAGYRVSGTATDSSGAGVATVTVRGFVASGGGAVAATATTDGQGNYTLVGLQNDTYHVVFVPASQALAAQTYNRQLSVATATPVVVSNADVTGIDAHLVAAFAVTGTAIDASTGQAFGSGVTVIAFTGSSIGCCFAVREVKTDANGNYLVGLANGQYKVQFSKTGRNTRWYSNALTWDIATDVTVNGAGVSNINGILSTPAAGSADLSVAKVGSGAFIVAGTPLTYTLVASTPSSATNVILTDILPANVSNVTAVASQGSCGSPIGGVVRCNFGSLAAGGSAAARITLTPTQAGALIDTANVAADQADPNAQNNVLTTSVTASFVSQTVGAGGTATSDLTGTGATSTNPVQTDVTSPTGGAVTIQETPASGGTSGWTFVGQQVNITAPTAADAQHPLRILFLVDASLVPAAGPSAIQVFKNGTLVADCTVATGTASPDPCVASRTTVAGGDVEVVVLTTTASVWNVAVDVTPPTITITNPAANATYTLNQPVQASYTCTDAGSGVATCSGTVADGAFIDTGSVGTKTFTVAATDKAGNSATPQSVTYQVTYGVCLLFDESKFVQRGSTVPIKLQLCDASGANVSDSRVTVTATSLEGGAPRDAGRANPGNLFRFDPTLGGSGGYIYNLQTTGLASGIHTLTFSAAGDASTHSVTVTVR